MASRLLREGARQAYVNGSRAQHASQQVKGWARKLSEQADEQGGWSAVAKKLARKDESTRAWAESSADDLDLAVSVGLAEAEMKLALAIYRQHEHRATSYRAQAVVMMKALELEAFQMLQALPSHRRQQLRQVAQEMKEQGLRASEQTRGDTQCGQCTRKLAPQLKGGDCCSGMVFLGWDAMDAMFRVLVGERAPVIEEFSGDETRCGFLRETGCALPEGTRPTVCTSYFCDGYKEQLTENGRWQRIGPILSELNHGRSQMGFKLKLAQRFVMGQTTRSREDHPLDFMWDKLRGAGAQRSAAGQRGNSELGQRLHVLNHQDPVTDGSGSKTP